MINEAVIKPSKSVLTPMFRKQFKSLDPQTQEIATDKYNRWIKSPASLNFEPKFGDIWSIEITRKIHAVCALEDGNIVAWLWIGKYDEYSSFVSTLRRGTERKGPKDKKTYI
jgi:hypothetical protein